MPLISFKKALSRGASAGANSTSSAGDDPQEQGRKNAKQSKGAKSALRLKLRGGGGVSKSSSVPPSSSAPESSKLGGGGGDIKVRGGRGNPGSGGGAALTSSAPPSSSASAGAASSTASTSTSTDRAADPPRGATVHTLIVSKSWPELRSYLSSSRGRTKTLRSVQDRDFVDRNFVHNVCAARPPADVVRTLVDLCPDLLSETDCMLRTPLHVAAAEGASREVMEILISEHRAASGMRDNRGQTPLCIAAGRLGKGTKEESRPTMGAIRALILSHPVSVLLEDKRGMTPVEHAIAVDAPDSVVRGLQHATTRVKQEMDKRDALRHSTIKESVEEAGGPKSTVRVPSSVELDAKKSGGMTRSEFERRLSDLSDVDIEEDSDEDEDDDDEGERDGKGNNEEEE